jgi:hypothetical protein
VNNGTVATANAATPDATPDGVADAGVPLRFSMSFASGLMRHQV